MSMYTYIWISNEVIKLDRKYIFDIKAINCVDRYIFCDNVNVKKVKFEESFYLIRKKYYVVLKCESAY